MSRRGHYEAPCGEPHDNYQDLTSHTAHCATCRAITTTEGSDLP